MPTKDELTEALKEMTARAEAAEARLTELEAAPSGDGAEYPMPLGEDDPDDASPTTTDPAAAVAAWQEIAIAGAEAMDENEALRTRLEEAKSDLDRAKGRIEAMQEAAGDLRMSAGSIVPLSHQEVADIIEDDHTTDFMVVQDYTFMGRTMQRGRRLRAQHYPKLLDYVKNGLRLVLAED